MKNSLKTTITVLTILPILLFGQADTTDGFSFEGSIGIDFIKDLIHENDTSDLWFNVSLKPELSLGNFGVGLYLPFRINQNGDFRNSDWDSPSDWVGVIRYLRVGKRNSPFLAKAGVLEHTSIGYGFIMDEYRNTIDENNRKTGLEIASDLKRGGGRILISNLGDAEVFAGRGFVRPVKFFAPLPVISNFETGISFGTDFEVDTTVSIVGMDAGIPILDLSFLDWEVYAHYANILGHGSGTGYGTRLGFKLPIKLLTVSLKLENRNLGSDFIPAYFNPFYEARREAQFRELHSDTLNEVTGHFAGLYVTLLGKLELTGNYSWTKKRGSGAMNLTLDATKFSESIPLSLTYSKRKITEFSDIFEFDEMGNTMWTLRAKPRILPFVYLTLEGSRKYMKVESQNTTEYRTIDKYSVSLGYKF